MIPTLTLKSGYKIPRIGLGTYMFGGGMQRDPSNDDSGQIKALKYAISRGITHIRTAQNYAQGHCEELVGAAIADMGRDKLFITVAVNENFGTDEKSIIKELYGSLARLNVDYVDLLLIGGVNPQVSLKQISLGLLKAKQLHLAKDIGTSNYRMKEFVYMNELVGDQLVYNELQYNLIIREPELDGMKNYLRDSKVVLGAYRALQQGKLTSPGIKLLDKISEKYDKSNSEIALQWLLSDPNIVPVVKSWNKKHIDEIASLFEWSLADEDVQSLSDNFPIQIKIGDCLPPSKIFTK